MNPVQSNRHLLDVNPRRLSMINAAHMSATGHSMHQRRTSIINYHQHRNSQLRKTSFTTSILTEREERGKLSIEDSYVP
ncbi:hypothetical protein I4U23_012044 [Adineta vaga]|nr:hypothetical protein I4U23_012044 [Adineta vaga]